MNKKAIFICSKMSPGPVRVIQNLKGVMAGVIDIVYEPFENFLIPRVHFKSRKNQYRYLRLQEYMQLMNINQLEKFKNNIFFVGWGTLNQVLLNKLNKKGIQPYLVMCSTIGQSDFYPIERKRIIEVMQNVKKGKIKAFLLNKRLFHSIGKAMPNSIFFPHTIDLHQYKNIIPTQITGNNIDLFCSVRPGKNTMNQILAFKLAHVPGSLHLNILDKLIVNYIKGLSVNAVFHKWMNDKKYMNFIAGMTISLQVTFTESFSYAVCERMCLSIPVLTSYDIYLIAEDKFLSKYLCINSLDTPVNIAERIRLLINDAKLREDLASRSRRRIEEISRFNNTLARDYLLSIIQ